MDSLAPSRSGVTQDLSGYSLPGGGSVNVDKAAMGGWSALVAVVQASYSLNAAAGVRVLWLYSPDGSNYDTPDDAVALGNYYDLSFAAGATRQATLVIPLLTPYARVQVINMDPSNACTLNVWTLFMR
jgi:hypothetical protein